MLILSTECYHATSKCMKNVHLLLNLAISLTLPLVDNDSYTTSNKSYFQSSHEQNVGR